MSIAEIVKLLQVEQGNHDTESAHVAADDLLCDLLSRLGCEEVVTEYKKVAKWYA